MTYKAVIFDLGGVVFGSPIEGINRYERLNNLPTNFINIFIVSTKHNAFKKLERGKLSITQFQKEFKKELDDPKAIDVYIKYMQKRKNIQLNRNDFPINGYNIDTADMFGKMSTYSLKIHKEMIHCLFMLRGLGYLTIALTNNFIPMSKIKSNPLLPYFDEIIESAVIGIRKPNPKIFQYALNKINKLNNNKDIIQFNNVIFLDDIGINLKSASALGIKTIKVNLNQQAKAIGELEGVLKLNKNTLVPKLNRYKCDIFGVNNCKLYGNALNSIVLVFNNCLSNNSIEFLVRNELFVIVFDSLDICMDVLMEKK
eukprot:360627_1